MLKRKHLLVAAAVAAAAPMAARAAVVTFSYGSIQYSTTINAGNGLLTGAITTVPIVGGSVTIPTGNFVSIPEIITVTGNANPEAGGTFATNNNAAQPANLGLGSYVEGVTDSAIAVVSPVSSTGAVLPAASGGNTYVKNNVSFNAAAQPGTIQANGTIGTSPVFADGVAGTVNSPGDTTHNNSTSAATALVNLTIGTGANTSLFTRLVYKVVGAGSSILTPVFNGTQTTVVFVQTPGTSSSAPVYSNRLLTGSDTLTLLSPLTITTGAVATKIISLTSTAAAAVTQTAFTGTYNPNLPTAGVVNVVGAGSSFVRGELNGIAAGAGSKTGLTGVKFENAAGTAVDPGIEYIGLNVADSAGAQGSAQFLADIQALINDINGSAFGLGATDAFATSSTATSDSLTNASAATQLAALGLNAGKVGAAQYDIVIGIPSVGGGNSFLGLDLTQDAALPAGLTVTDIAAVPEPATAAGLLIGASGLLLGRRKRKA